MTAGVKGVEDTSAAIMMRKGAQQRQEEASDSIVRATRNKVGGRDKGQKEWWKLGWGEESRLI